MDLFGPASFEKWQSREGLLELDADFLVYLEAQAPLLCSSLVAMRKSGEQLTGEPLMHMAVHLDAFLSALFGIEAEVFAEKAKVVQAHPIIAFKKHFVQKEAKRYLRKQMPLQPFSVLDAWVRKSIAPLLKRGLDREAAVATFAIGLLAKSSSEEERERLIHWCAHGLSEHHQAVAHWVSFQSPEILKVDAWVKSDRVEGEGLVHHASGKRYRPRVGFDCLDAGLSDKAVLDHTHYCVYCHDKSTDFCRSGFPEKPKDPNSSLKTNALGDVLTGCPLDQKISEMHALKADGEVVAPLAVVMIDNPMCPATGHRICNDCAKACIYQKQTPVDTPGVESAILHDVLRLPWGVEIYDLLTRWNPLRAEQYLPKANNGDRVLVMGLGPAGFTLMHHLSMEGFDVVGMDGAPLKAAPDAWYQPIYSIDALFGALSEREPLGFGGVAEYGITARWDKHHLSLLYLTLLRRSSVRMTGSVRFGGTLQLDDVWAMGFDHLALATGAGLPKELNIPNSLAPGMRSASDFLMALHLSDATQKKSHSILDVSLPALVIGGGLTAVDAATEIQAYYLHQIERVLSRFETLIKDASEKTILAAFSSEEQKRLQRWLEHGRELRKARQAHRGDEPFDPKPLLVKWGGVKIVYRRSLQASPAYRTNPLEVQAALDQGIDWLEHANPHQVLVDADGEVSGLEIKVSDKTHTLQARSILVATGLRLNVAYEFEHRGSLARMDTFAYQTFDFEGNADRDATSKHCKEVLYPVSSDSRISLLGDLHPMFQGSVVKAMASAKRIYPLISAHLQSTRAKREVRKNTAWLDQVMIQCQSRVQSVLPIAEGHSMVSVLSPQTAARCKLGHLCQLRPHTGDPITAVVVEVDQDQLHFVLSHQNMIKHGWSDLQAGMPLDVLGPSGIAFNAPKTKEPQLCITDALFWPLALAKARFLKSHGIETAILFERESGDASSIKVLSEYASVYPMDDLSEDTSEWAKTWQASACREVSLYVQPQHVQHYRCTIPNALAWLPSTAHWQVAVIGPFQCLLKGVCAQCLQWQVDPATGKRTKAVYSCSWPYQSVEMVDLQHLVERQYLGGIQKKLHALSA